MASNLVSLVMQFLTPEMVGRVATALGLDRSLVQSAINAAVPGLLGSTLANKSQIALLTCAAHLEASLTPLPRKRLCRNCETLQRK
jgi:hypothetical protein